MHTTTIARRWFQLSAVYFAVGVWLGIAMGALGDHTLYPVHTHLNLLGWASMALFGLIGSAMPGATQGRMAVWQFWLYNLSLPLMLAALAFKLKGYAALEPALGLASFLVGIAVLMFAALTIVSARRGNRPAVAPPADEIKTPFGGTVLHHTRSS